MNESEIECEVVMTRLHRGYSFHIGAWLAQALANLRPKQPLNRSRSTTERSTHEFSTCDIALASHMAVRGCPVLVITRDQANKASFCFEEKRERPNQVLEFSNGSVMKRWQRLSEAEKQRRKAVLHEVSPFIRASQSERADGGRDSGRR
jgi:hypothetical protein